MHLSDAVTIPDNFVCAFYTLADSLGLPLDPVNVAPFPLSIQREPFLVYGGGTTSAQYTIQLLKIAKCQNIIAAASPVHHDYLRSIGATAVLDYRSPTFAEDVLKAAGGPVKYALEPVATLSTLKALAKVVGDGSKVAVLMPVKLGQEGLIGGEGSSLHFAIPEEVNPFGKGVTVKMVSTFVYDQVSTFSSAFLVSSIDTHIRTEPKVPRLDASHVEDVVGVGFHSADAQVVDR